MEINYFIIVPALLIAMAISTESFGALMRSIGASVNLPTVGYSAHVRIATIGRIFIIGSAPLIGMFVDKYHNPRIIILLGALTFLISTILHLLIMYSPMFKSILPRYIFSVLTKNIYKTLPTLKNKYNFLLNKRVFYGSMLTVSVQSAGIFVVNAFAAQTPSFSATIVQMTGIVTFLGTAVHIFLVDPILASHCDAAKKHNRTIDNYIAGRLGGSFINFLLFLIFFLLYN